MVAALSQFFGAAPQQCVEVRFQWSHDSLVFNITDYFTNYENVTFIIQLMYVTLNTILYYWFTNYI